MSNGHEKMAAQIRDETGRCWSCDYLLRGVESGRCPECGRGFDQVTMNLGRPVGDLARGLIGPMSVWMVVMLWVGAVLIVWGTRWPGDWDFWRVDRMVFSHLGNLKEQWNVGGIRWRSFAIGLVMTIAMGGAAMVRELIRRLLIRWHRPPEDLQGSSRRRLLFLVAGLMLATIWVGAGSARRWGTVWAGRQKAQPVDLYGSIPTADPPVPLMPGEETVIVRRLLKSGDESERRIALKLLMERNAEAALPVLREAIADERDEQIAVAELHLIGLYRDASTEQLLEKFLHDDRAGVRAAASDAIGIVHDPAFELPEQSHWMLRQSSVLRIDPSINISAFNDRLGLERHRLGGTDYFVKEIGTVPMSPAHWETLQSLMTSGQTAAEREAGARALLLWPKSGYHLRIAEWGVWLNDDGELKTMRKIADEIPAFVHRSGNPISEFAERIRPIVIITKPVIHLTASEAMPVDIEVRIRDGRPWYVYPMPDDFEVQVDSKQESRQFPLLGSTQPMIPAKKRVHPLAKFDAPELGRLDSVGSGYPWITPNHRLSGTEHGRGNPFNEITEVGVHWQSLIVSPNKLSWMTEPPVGDEARFAWWKRLRDVDCSWVSNRGESERFLYYDGPTNLKPPFRFFLDENRLESLVYEPSLPDRLVLGNIGASPGHLEPRRTFVNNDGWVGLFIRVKGNEITGQALDQPLGQGAMLHGIEVQQALVDLVRRRGLTESESAGFIDCWKSEFFGKPGARVLLLMTQGAYDQFCPITVRPKPTEMVRVGIVLTELK